MEFDHIVNFDSLEFDRFLNNLPWLEGRICIHSGTTRKENIVMELLMAVAELRPSRVLNGHLRRSEWRRLTTAAKALSHMPIYIDSNNLEDTK